MICARSVLLQGDRAPKVAGRKSRLACVALPLAGAAALSAFLPMFLKNACVATGLAAGAAFIAVQLFRLAPRNSVRMAVCMAANEIESGEEESRVGLCSTGWPVLSAGPLIRGLGEDRPWAPVAMGVCVDVKLLRTAT